MISVDEAEKLVLYQARDYGDEVISIDKAFGRVLVESVYADRDYPPGDRSTMDGIAIAWSAYEKGQQKFKIKVVQQAGDTPLRLSGSSECVQIMTGAVLPSRVDTVIPIEDIKITSGQADIKAAKARAGQFVHRRGADRTKGSLIIEKGTLVTPDAIAVLASIGQTQLRVKRLPAIIVVTTGDELVNPDAKVSKYKIRRSNDLMMAAVLTKYGVKTERLHLADDPHVITKSLKKCLNKYDVVLLSGGVSRGEFDYVQTVLPKIGVKNVFHGIRQKPGKPFWFGYHPKGPVVFAFPGNPVSTFVCLLRYFSPWLEKSIGLGGLTQRFAVLDKGVSVNNRLTNYIPVKLEFKKDGVLHASPISSNGSGDFISLVSADAFAQLDEGKSDYKKDTTCRIWLYK